jgi:hypothetical protein
MYHDFLFPPLHPSLLPSPICFHSLSFIVFCLSLPFSPSLSPSLPPSRSLIAFFRLTLSYLTVPYLTVQCVCIVCYRVVTREFAAESVADMEEWVSRVQACIDRCDGTDKDKEGAQKKSLTFVNTPLRTEAIDKSKPDVHITSDSNTETVRYSTPLNLALTLFFTLALTTVWFID